MTIRTHAALAAGLALLAGACSQQAPSAEAVEQAQPSPPAQFSQREKEAARKLSLSGGTVLASDAFSQAVECRTALHHLQDRLRQSGALGAAQLRAMAEGETLFTQRAIEAGAGARRSEASVRKALDAAAREPFDLAEQARTALACVRSAEPAGTTA